MGTSWRGAFSLALALGTASGCTSLLGDFASGGGGSTGDGGKADVQAGTGDGGSSSSGGPSTDAMSDTGVTPMDASDEGEAAPPPPPAAGKPGFDLTSGGNSGASINYKLRSALGEAPGGYVIGKSSSYVLKGGVIAGTQ